MSGWYETQLVTELTTIPPPCQTSLLIVEMLDDGSFKSDLEEVVSVWSYLALLYRAPRGSLPEPGKAPHHTALEKAGWKFVGSARRLVPVIFRNNRYVDQEWLDEYTNTATVMVDSPLERDRLVEELKAQIQRKIDARVKVDPNYHLGAIDSDFSHLNRQEVVLRLKEGKEKVGELANDLIRLMQFDPTMTLEKMAFEITQEPSWIIRLLKLTKLTAAARRQLENGMIGMANAVALVKLPVEEQDDWTERAQWMEPTKFFPNVNARLREIRDAKKQEKRPSKAVD